MRGYGIYRARRVYQDQLAQQPLIASLQAAAHSAQFMPRHYRARMLASIPSTVELLDTGGQGEVGAKRGGSGGVGERDAVLKYVVMTLNDQLFRELALGMTWGRSYKFHHPTFRFE